ncbi:CoA transferase [Variovorax sp. DT-64]|uniref:CoA transferase n=1 Tax=Variovorax sp. DT-64 TaxID=3396160 RepID=UPI003F1DCB81
MRPLEGLTVVALEHAIAAPFATRQLADLGARVIKIERPGSGDFARGGYDERVALKTSFVMSRSKSGRNSVKLGPDFDDGRASC